MKRFLVALGLLSAFVLAVGFAGADDKAQDQKKPADKKGGFGKRGGGGFGGFGDPTALLKKADANNDGKVTKEEFTKAFEGFGQGKGGEFAERLFERLDADKNGSIDAEELKKAGGGFGGAGGFGKGKFDPKKLEELKKKFGGDGKFDPKKLEELKKKFGGKGDFDPEKLKELLKRKKDFEE